MKLLNPKNAVITQQKIQDYLLSLAHPIGRFKAVRFRELGFNQDNWELFRFELHACLLDEAIEKERTNYGIKYEICSSIKGPAGKSMRIVTAWIIRKDEDFPRLVTAYPGD